MICSIDVPQSRKTIDRSTESGEGQAELFGATASLEPTGVLTNWPVLIHAARFREEECNPCRAEKVAELCRDVGWVPPSKYAVAIVFG
jgi:hypothetical protein